MRLAVVVPSRGNLFMRELLEPLVAELVALGVEARFVADRFPPLAEDLVYAIVPHELFDATDPADHPSRAELARTVAIMTEQPGTIWFERALEIARDCGAVVDISEVGRVESRRRGLASELLQLGYTPLWDRWGGDPAAARPLDVLFLGSINRRRERHLASYAGALEPLRVRFQLPEMAAKSAPDPTFVAGDDRLELIASATTVLNLRAIIPPYFVWQRAIEAISNGAVLVSEHGAGHAPLVPGEHFVSGAPESLALLAHALVHDPERAAAIRDRAYRFLVDELPLAPGARRFAEVAESLAGARNASEGPDPALAGGQNADEGSDPVFAARRPDFTDPAADPLPGAAPDSGELGARHKRLALEHLALRRRVAADELRDAGGDPDAIEVVYESPGYERAAPRTTVCIPLYQHAGEIEAALASVAASTSDDFDVLVLDDASRDDSAGVAAAFLADRPWLPAAVLRRAVNAGLPAGRNDLLARACGAYALVLDSDNELYPRAIERLSAALDADPGATFAYGILAAFRAGEPEGLLSFTPWHPPVFARRNPIDALALLRREAVLKLGGYTTDPRLHGWEDYELWVRIAAAGGHGAHVPTFVGRYNRIEGSMLALTDLDEEGATAALRELHPAIMGSA